LLEASRGAVVLGDGRLERQPVGVLLQTPSTRRAESDAAPRSPLLSPSWSECAAVSSRLSRTRAASPRG
jgi:hypothetical protein